MIVYLKNTYAAVTILSRVGAKRDLESCVMCKDEHPKILFEQLMGVQLKYAGNVQAQVVEGDLVTQAIQALPAMYNSTIANFLETEQQAGRVVTLLALQKVVSNYYAIATKGKQGPKYKDIKGGLVAMEDQNQAKEKDNLKRMIQETINTTIHEYHMRYQPSGVNQGQGGGHRLAAGNFMNMGNNGGQYKNQMTPEMLVVMQAAQGNGKEAAQIDTSTMLCYCCRQYGHRASDCKNLKNFELVAQVLKSQGHKPCEHCGQFGHPPRLCWTLPENAHLRSQYPRVNLYDQGGPNVNQDSTAKLNLRPHKGGNMSIDQDTRSEGELSLAHMDDEEIKTINESLKGMGLQLSDPNVWIGDTGATMHNTAFIENTINHRAAHAKDNILGISGPPAEAKTIVDIPCEVVQDGKKVKMTLKDVTYVPDSRYNLLSLTKLMSNRKAPGSE
jgi:hypothetical protein